MKVFTINKTKKQTFILGFLIGCLVFIGIYGINVLRFTNINWLLHSDDLEGIWDLTQHYLGWVSYRNTPWTFPIGLTKGITAEPISVVYTDSIPLFAVLFKILSPLLPEQFQYFGLFEILSYGLMGGFGALIPYKYSKNLWYDMMVALFFVLSPALLKRGLYHTALSAHFLISIAFCLWIYQEDLESYKKRTVFWALLCVCATWINPYYTPMVVGIMLCAQLYDIMEHKTWNYNIVQCMVCEIAIIFAAWFIGMFYGSVSASGASLENLSANLNSLVNPRDMYLQIPHAFHFIFTDNVYSSLLKGLPYGIEWQEEGFGYLGCGMILLAAIAIMIMVIKLIRKKTVKPSIVVSSGICFVVFMALALGPICYLNQRVIYNIHWPQKIYNLLSIFRSTGRFIWPIHFGIMTLIFIVIACNLREKKKKWMLVVPCICLVIQIIDLVPAYQNKHQRYAGISYDASTDFPDYLLEDDVWDIIGRNSDEIIFYKPTEITICMSPEISCSFEMFAQRYHLTLNATYCSRSISVAADKYATKAFEERCAGKRDTRQVFVFINESDIPDNYKEAGLELYQINGLWVGSDLTLDISGN